LPSYFWPEPISQDFPEKGCISAFTRKKISDLSSFLDFLEFFCVKKQENVSTLVSALLKIKKIKMVITPKRLKIL